MPNEETLMPPKVVRVRIDEPLEGGGIYRGHIVTPFPTVAVLIIALVIAVAIGVSIFLFKLATAAPGSN